MPSNPHYEAVRAKIIAACPELMELNKDCLVQYSKKGTSYPYKRRETDYYCGQCQEGTLSGQAFTSYRCGYCRKGFSHPNTGTPRYCKDCAQKHLVCQYCACYFVIIGSPIRLSHVIRTLAQQRIKDFNFAHSYRNENELYIGLVETSIETMWDLTKHDLSEQDPSVWEALDKMLSV